MKLTHLVAVALLGFSSAELVGEDAQVPQAGFQALTMIVSQTASGGQELVVITRRPLR